MSKKIYTLHDDFFSISMMNITLPNNIIPRMDNKIFLLPPTCLNDIKRNHYKPLNSHRLITTRIKLKNYGIVHLLKDYLFKDIEKENCTIALGPFSGRKERFFRLFHIDESFRNSKIWQSRIFQSNSKINNESKTLYDLIGRNKFYAKDSPESVYIIVFNHSMRSDLQSNELNKFFLLKYLDLFPIEGLGDLENTCNIFKKKQNAEKEIGDFLGQRGLKMDEIRYILKNIHEKTLLEAVNLYMNLRLTGIYFTEEHHQDIYLKY